MTIHSEYTNLVAEKRVLERTIQAYDKKVKVNKARLGRLEEARIILTEVTRQTQSYFKDRVEKLVTMAIQSVYDRKISFKFILLDKNNRLNCIPKVEENGHEFNLEFSKAGGLLDIVSLAFQVVLWSLRSPRSRPVFILDEPVKFVGKGDLLLRAGRLIRKLSHELNLQFIITTHEAQLARIAADKIFHVTYDGKESTVEEAEDVEDAQVT